MAGGRYTAGASETHHARRNSNRFCFALTSLRGYTWNR